ncbi:TPA: RHS domain-containing protein [Escherichia coli]
MLGRLERELRAGAVSAESEAWLAQCGLTAEQMAAQMEAEYIPERKLHLYHCDHRGLPQALISPEGETAWCGEYDEWGNLLGETSAQHLQQSLRLTASRKMRTMSTATMNTAGWRRRRTASRKG